MTEKLLREGNAQGHNLHLVHNNLSEDLAFRKIVRLARHTEAGVYFVHTTAKEGVAAIAEARSQGQPVYGEALHNYLEFTCEDYKKPGGTAIHTYPAIKFAEDREALLAGLLDGRLCTTATDEYTTYKGVKLSGNTIESVCGGHNGIETRLPVAFTKFVAQRHMARLTARTISKIAPSAPAMLRSSSSASSNRCCVSPTNGCTSKPSPRAVGKCCIKSVSRCTACSAAYNPSKVKFSD